MEDHTFVIPVYMESPYLEACIQSLLGQTVKSKIIITTSTPTTFTKQLAAAYHIPYFVNDTDDKGAATNWNYALSQAETKFVTLAHQDDLYENNFTETVLKKIEQHNRADLLIAFTNYKDTINGTVRNTSLNTLVKNIMLSPFHFSGAIRSRSIKKAMLAFGNPVCCPSVTFNMPMLDNFQFATESRSMLDWFAWYQLARRQGSFIYINKKLVQHRLHTTSGTSILIGNGEKLRDEQQMFELMWGKRFARLITKVYALGYKDNLV